MTTGEPLIVRCAMKPLPTLTKPLRSVDIATREPAAGAARAHRLVHRPGRRAWWGRRCWRSCWPTPTARSSAATTSTTCAPRSRPTSGASDGSAEPSSSSASWARARRRRRAPPRACSASGRSTPTTCSSGGSARSIEEYFASHGEARVPRARGGGRLRPARAPARAGAVARRRRRRPPSACAALLDRHTVVLLDVDVETAWRRAGNKRRPLARDRDRFAALHAERAPLYESLADAVLLDSSRDEVRQAVPALRALARAPAGTKLLWAAAASGSYPVYVGEGLLGSGFWPVPGRRFVVTDDDGRRALPASPDVGGRAARCRRARSTRRSPPSSGCCAAWPTPAWTTTTTWWRSAAASSATSPASAPPSTSAASGSCRCRPRSWPRSTRPTAARPASTCRRARTTPAPTTSRPRCSPTRRRWRRSRRPSSRPAGPR